MKYQILPKKCLTIDIRHVKSLRLSKFRFGTKNGKKQICYYNYNKKYRAFSRFLAVRKQTSTGEVIFSIVNLIDKLIKFKNSYYKIEFKIGIQKFDQRDTKRPRTAATGGGSNNCTGRQISKKSRFLSR